MRRVTRSIAAAQLAQAHDVHRGLPDGYDTMVGQGGLTLSGGQRQRLGIARAMVRDAPILILDEPSSGLDLESERLVFEGLNQLFAGDHLRDRAPDVDHPRATVILVLDEGRIVERGTHAELWRSGGLSTRNRSAPGCLNRTARAEYPLCFSGEGQRHPRRASAARGVGAGPHAIK